MMQRSQLECVLKRDMILASDIILWNIYLGSVAFHNSSAYCCYSPIYSSSFWSACWLYQSQWFGILVFPFCILPSANFLKEIIHQDDPTF